MTSIPMACRYVVPRQRQFRADLAVVNDCLDELIVLAKRTQQPEDIEALQSRDYTKVWLLYSCHFTCNMNPDLISKQFFAVDADVSGGL